MKKEPQLYHEDLTKRGIIRLRDRDMFTVWIKPDCCNLTSTHLRKIADITEKYARSYLLFTTNQNAVIPFVHIKDVENVLAELEEVSLRLDRCGPTVRNIKVCYDDKVCHEAATSCLSLADKLEVFFDTPLGHKLKIGVVGCEKDCLSSRVLTDVSFMGVNGNGSQGYDVFVGGKLGLDPFIGERMAECLSEKESVRFLQNYFDFMSREGKPGERSANLIRRIGAATIREELNKNLQDGLDLQPIASETRLTENITDKIILSIRATLGQVNSTRLRKIADIADNYGKGFIHCTIRCAPEIPGIDQKQLAEIKQELAEADLQILDSGIDNIQGCCFGAHCTENIMDPHPLLVRLEQKVAQLGLNNLKVSVSSGGCPNSCGFPQISDFGFYGAVEPQIDITKCNGCELCVPICRTRTIAMKGNLAVIDLSGCRYCAQCVMACPFDAIVAAKKGFNILAGGREGKDIRLGEEIAEYLSEDEAFRVIGNGLRVLKEKNASAATVIDEVGIEKFKDMLAITSK